MIEQAVAEQAVAPGALTLGTDNASAFTARKTRQVPSGLGAREVIAAYIDRYHHRLDYRTPSEIRPTWDDAPKALRKAAA